MAAKIGGDGQTSKDEVSAAIAASPTSDDASRCSPLTTSASGSPSKSSLSRKRSFKRPAPPPPLHQSSASRPSTPCVGVEAQSDVPDAPPRSLSSVEATKKFQSKYLPADNIAAMSSQATVFDHPTDSSEYEFIDRACASNYYPYVNFPGYPPPRVAGPQYSPYGAVYYPPPGWDDRKGVIHSASEGSFVRYRRPVTSGPLVPVLEEPLDGPPSPATSVSTPPLSPSYSASPSRRRLNRSDSLITVAHLHEDLYVVTPFFRLTLTNLTCIVVVAALALPNTAALLYTFFRLVFGTLFPAYYSYKAVKTKNVKEYVKWMMYWIVFAFFSFFETITDLVLAFWFPFYYELKILLVLWLLSPATRGSSVLYRRFVHPWLTQREDEIDDCIARAKEQGYSTVLQLGTKGVNYATAVIMQTAIKGGGGLVNQLKRSYSVGELGDPDDHMNTGDLNRNIKALPGSDVPDYDNHRHHTGTSQPGTQVNAGITKPGTQANAGITKPGTQPNAGITKPGTQPNAGITKPGTQANAGITKPGTRQHNECAELGNQRQFSAPLNGSQRHENVSETSGRKRIDPEEYQSPDIFSTSSSSQESVPLFYEEQQEEEEQAQEEEEGQASFDDPDFVVRSKAAPQPDKPRMKTRSMDTRSNKRTRLFF